MKSNTPVLTLDLILDVMLNGRLSVSVLDVHGPVVHLELRYINNQPFWMRKRLIPHPRSLPNVLRLEARTLPLMCPHAYSSSG